MEDKDIMIRFHPRVRELDRNFEKLNNQDFDNGVYHKYAYKQKVNQKKEEVKEENIKQSDVQMNNLVADNTKDANTARKRRREKADINYHNYYIKISKFHFATSLKLTNKTYLQMTISYKIHQGWDSPYSIYRNVYGKTPIITAPPHITYCVWTKTFDFIPSKTE